MKREKIAIKKVNIYQRDYSNFSSGGFQFDVPIQNWNYSHNNGRDSFKDFYIKFEGSVNRHAPIKKVSLEEIKSKNKCWLNAEYFASNMKNIKKTPEGIREIANIKKISTETSQLNVDGKIIVNDK